LVIVSLLDGASAINYLERFVSEVTYYVSSDTLNFTQSLAHSVIPNTTFNDI